MATSSVKGALGRILSIREGRSKTESKIRQAKNVLKHVRIAKATTGHEHNVHVKKAMKLHKKYRSIMECLLESWM